MSKFLSLFFILLLSGLVAELPEAELRVQSAGIPESRQSWPGIALVQEASGLSAPVHVTHAGDGSGRLFVVEQAGRIIILQGGQPVGVFLDIQGRVRSPTSGGGSEEGLLSLAFPPGYGSSLDHFYVYYTNKNSDNQLSRFSLGSGPNQADPGSEEILLVIPHPAQNNHNGGQLAFGPDGYLYIGTGDGGGGGDPLGNAQNPSSLLGKLLRLDVDPVLPNPAHPKVYLPLARHQSSEGGSPPPNVRHYAIPTSNPFFNNPTFRPEIWALGLRNPWRFSFDRQTGDLYIGDVGQNLWEEIDFLPANSAAGTNFGWPYLEGTHTYRKESPPAGLELVAPIYEYSHSDGCSVTGGFAYRGSQLPEWNGIYLFSDYCSGWVRGLLRTPQGKWQEQDLFQNIGNISSFGEDQSGELYLVDLGGNIYQLTRK